VRAHAPPRRADGGTSATLGADEAVADDDIESSEKTRRAFKAVEEEVEQFVEGLRQTAGKMDAFVSLSPCGGEAGAWEEGGGGAAGRGVAQTVRPRRKKWRRICRRVLRWRPR
jgi:hypothetical protein